MRRRLPPALKLWLLAAAIIAMWYVFDTATGFSSLKETL